MEKTISELSFERFCIENCISFNRITEKDTPTPDYFIDIKGKAVFVEVKELNEDSKTDKIISKVKRNGILFFWEENGHSVRLKINSAKKQLREAAKECCSTILVLLNNTLSKVVDSEDIMSAMYGEILSTIKFTLNKEILKSKNTLGGKRKCTSISNTSLSAIGLLYKNYDNLFNISIFHNFYAKYPISHGLLAYSSIKQYFFNPELDNNCIKWEEIKV